MTATNHDRAEWARTAVVAFREDCSGSKNADGSPDIEEAVGDLICDLCHLCDKEGIDPVDLIRKGLGGFVQEKLDPTHGGMSHEADVAIDVLAKRYGQPREPWVRFEWKPGYDDAQAKREGWALFVVDNGKTMIQRLDDPRSCGDDFPEGPVFASDDDAIAFVRQRAAEGSAMHRDALDRHDKSENQNPKGDHND